MILDLLFYVLVLVVAFYLLLKASDYLIASSSELGKRAGISKFVIGLTIVAIGTSLPELFTSIIAIFTSSNPTPFILGTVIGSNVANILLVFGIFIIFSKKFSGKLKIFDVVFLLIATLLLIYLVLGGVISYLEGILFIGVFIIYIYYSIKGGKKKELIAEAEEIDLDGLCNKSILYLVVIFILSLIGLNLGARGIVFGIENLGILLHISIAFLTLTTVAFATSLPEIVVSYHCAKKKEFDIAIGNILGSNISNILLIIGVSSMFKVILINPVQYLVSLGFLAIATILFILFLNLKKIKTYHGFFLLCLYFIYLYMIF